MTCAEIENQVLDWDELSPAQSSAVAAHLAECARCRAFAGQAQRLDIALGSAPRAPKLPSDFQVRLKERIQAQALLTGGEYIGRKQQLQAEFAAGAARLREQTFALGRLRRYLLQPTLALAAVWFVCLCFSKWLGHQSSPSNQTSLMLNPALWLAASLAFALVFLMVSRPQRRLA